MLRRAIIFLIIPLVISGLVFGAIYLRKINKPKIEAIDLLPSDCAFILRINNFSETLKKLKNTKIWDELIYLEYFKNLDKQSDFLDSLLNSNAVIKQIIGRHEVYISAYLSAETTESYLFFIQLKNSQEKKVISKFLQKNFINPVPEQGTDRGLKKQIIRRIKFSAGETRYLNFAFINNFLLMSYSDIIIEDAIRQASDMKIRNPKSEIRNNSLLSDNHFKEIFITAGNNVDINIFINYKIFPLILNNVLLSGVKEEIKKYLAEISNIGYWTGFDLIFKDESFFLNGFTTCRDTAQIPPLQREGVGLFPYFSTLLFQEPQKIEIPEIIPANTFLLVWLGISDLNTYCKKITPPASLSPSERDKMCEVFTNWFANQLAMVITSTKNLQESTYAILKITDTALVLKSLQELTFIVSRQKPEARSQKPEARSQKPEARGQRPEARSQLPVANIQHPISNIQHPTIQQYKNFPIYYIPVKNLISDLFGNIFCNLENTYYTFIENYVIFGNSATSLKIFINYYLSQRTLNRNKYYRHFTENLSTKANCYVYFNLPKIFEIAPNFLNPKSITSYDLMLSGMTEQIRNPKSLYGFGIQFSNHNNEILYSNIYLNYNPVEEKEGIERYWQVNLNTNLCLKPFLVTNHLTKEKDILVQDNFFQIYLISNKGEIYWKKKIDGKIISNIYEIDYFKNNKMQYLFNTKNYVYLFDRRGNNVKNFPLKLKFPATNGVAVFDYDKKKDYRILVACEDKKVYNYKKEGTSLPDWAFGKTKEIVKNTIQHYVVADKDYIVVVDVAGNLYIVDRRGKIRLQPKKQFPISQNNELFFFDDKTLSDSYLITTDTAGTVYKIYFDGEYDSTVVSTFSSDHLFGFSDINNDNENEYIFLDPESTGTLSVFTQNTELLWSYSFLDFIPSEEISKIIKEQKHIRTFDKLICLDKSLFPNNYGKIGICCYYSDELYLFNYDGLIYEGFPLTGNVPFTIGTPDNSNKLMLIGGYNNVLFVYKL